MEKWSFRIKGKEIYGQGGGNIMGEGCGDVFLEFELGGKYIIIIGILLGIAIGFSGGGIGGALLGAIIGPILLLFISVFLCVLILNLVFIGIPIAIIALIFWIIVSLWGVGI